MRKKLFDTKNHCLVYRDCEANERFWDKKWEGSATNTFSNPPHHGSTIRVTRQYLPAGSRVLEGGCGLGDVVYALNKAGYKADGVDYAPNVVRAINANWPHLNVTEGDVRNLSVQDDCYDGYWSIGVIEHFSDGYDAIAREMKRVLRPGGYLFLSFPAFNRFRQGRAITGKYPQSTVDPVELTDFFQFALNPLEVKEKFESMGFRLVERRGLSSLLGLAEDLPVVAAVQNFLNHLHPRVCTGVSILMDLFLGRYAGHSCLLVFQNI